MSRYKILTDLHTHTVASTHAFSTVVEMASSAEKNGIKLIAITDHGPAEQDSPHIWHFECMSRVPDYINGVRILKGVECNILNENGDTDYNPKYMSSLQVIIASVHSPTYVPSGKEEYFTSLKAAAMDEMISIIGHMSRYGFAMTESDFEPVLQACIDNNKLVEINSSCLENELYLKNTRALVRACKNMSAKVAVNSDAHICFEVGDFSAAVSLLEKEHFPQSLIVNSDVESVLEYFSLR